MSLRGAFSCEQSAAVCDAAIPGHGHLQVLGCSPTLEIASLRLAGPAHRFASGAYFWWVRGINRRVTQNALTRPTYLSGSDPGQPSRVLANWSKFAYLLVAITSVMRLGSRLR